MTATVILPTTALDAPAERGAGAAFAHLRVGTKIIGVILLLSVVAVASGAYAVASIRAVAAQTESLSVIQELLVHNRGTVHQDQLKARMIAAQIAAVQTSAAKDGWLPSRRTTTPSSRPRRRRTSLRWAALPSPRTGRTSGPTTPSGSSSVTRSSSRLGSLGTPRTTSS